MTGNDGPDLLALDGFVSLVSQLQLRLQLFLSYSMLTRKITLVEVQIASSILSHASSAGVVQELLLVAFAIADLTRLTIPAAKVRRLYLA